MVVECTQTAHQKETVKLIKDFFSSIDTDSIFRQPEWGTNIISKLFGTTGIKFDKPFMAEVFEGSFTTDSLLKKYPINESQIMYIHTISKPRYSWSGDIKATRVYHNGKVYTCRNKNIIYSEQYFHHYNTDDYYTIDDYNDYRKNAIKTLVLVANKENVVKINNRKPISVKECNLIYDTLYNHEYDESRPNIRKSLANKLDNHRKYIKLQRVVTTDYSQELQTRYDEIIVLKNLIATNAINSTDSETLRTLNYLMDKITDVIDSHENIVSKLEKSRELYEQCGHKILNYEDYGHYDKVADVKEDLKDLDRSIKDIRTELFDRILQQDIA